MSDKIITYHVSPYHSIQGTQAEIEEMIEKLRVRKSNKRKQAEQ